MKAFVTYFKASKRLSEVKTAIGTNQETHEMFHRVVAWLIKFMIGKVTADPQVDRDLLFRIPWPSTTQLQQMEITQVEWLRPKDQMLEHSRYVPLHGDPDTNDKGHKTVHSPDGVKLVNMGNNGIWEKVASVIFQSVKKRVCDDGTDEASQAFVGKQYRDLSSDMLARNGIGRGPSAPSSSEVPLVTPPPLATPVRQRAQVPNEHDPGFVGGGGGEAAPALHSPPVIARRHAAIARHHPQTSAKEGIPSNGKEHSAWSAKARPRDARPRVSARIQERRPGHKILFEGMEKRMP